VSKKEPLVSATPVERLTALWALNEAGLGGVLHALRWPFTGILVGGIAVILVTLIAYFAESRWRAILRATAVVILVKAMVSPHTPLQAYFAVAFQGLIGAALFSTLPGFRVPALLVALLAMLEASLQKLFVLSVIYGTSLWHALNLFFEYASREFGQLHLSSVVTGSELVISGYVGLHLLGGIAIGWVAGKLPGRIRMALEESDGFQWSRYLQEGETEFRTAHRKKRRKRWLSVASLLVLILLIFLWRNPNARGLSQAAYVVLRAVTVLTLWYAIFAPLLMRLLQRTLRRRRMRYTDELTRTMQFLPALRGAAIAIWLESRRHGGLAGLRFFLKSLILFALLFEPSAEDVAESAPLSNPPGE